MKEVITQPALRIKVTGICNRSCFFCHEEGDMKTIGAVEADENFFVCVGEIQKYFHLRKVMLTGGEPTIHPQLDKIVGGIDSEEISITSNGIQHLDTSHWKRLKNLGLRRVIFSIHDVVPQTFLELETRNHQFDWAVRALDSQRRNVISASEAGLEVRINTVVYNSASQALNVLNVFEDLQREHGFDIRLLNDLSNVDQSQSNIKEICQTLDAKEIGSSRRAGSSNATMKWQSYSGMKFSTKMAIRYFFSPLCGECKIKAQCHEGFYGIRLERRNDDYWVRLCIYKQGEDVLMPWQEFLKSDLAHHLKNQFTKEQIT